MMRLPSSNSSSSTPSPFSSQSQSAAPCSRACERRSSVASAIVLNSDSVMRDRLPTAFSIPTLRQTRQPPRARPHVRPRPQVQVRRILPILRCAAGLSALALVLSACGTKGALFLPPSQQKPAEQKPQPQNNKQQAPQP